MAHVSVYTLQMVSDNISYLTKSIWEEESIGKRRIGWKGRDCESQSECFDFRLDPLRLSGSSKMRWKCNKNVANMRGSTMNESNHSVYVKFFFVRIISCVVSPHFDNTRLVCVCMYFGFVCSFAILIDILYMNGFSSLWFLLFFSLHRIASTIVI